MQNLFVMPKPSSWRPAEIMPPIRDTSENKIFNIYNFWNFFPNFNSTEFFQPIPINFDQPSPTLFPLLRVINY